MRTGAAGVVNAVVRAPKAGDVYCLQEIEIASDWIAGFSTATYAVRVCSG
jgi:hypothetical protein